MFTDFFYTLKKVGIPVSPTSFLRLQKALGLGVITSLDDFYTGARAILVKSERYFDLYDQVFAHLFKGAELKDPDEFELTDVARAMLEVDWHTGHITRRAFWEPSRRNAGWRSIWKQIRHKSSHG